MEKPLTDFRIRTRKDPRPRPSCRACDADAAKQAYHNADPKTRKLTTRQWERDNPVLYQAQKNRRKFREKGIEPTVALMERLETQRHCDSCGDHVDGYLHIDHDHSTQKFRGLLCSPCNVGLGNFYDSSTRLRRAIEYLNRHNTAETAA